MRAGLLVSEAPADALDWRVPRACPVGEFLLLGDSPLRISSARSGPPRPAHNSNSGGFCRDPGQIGRNRAK